jgi:hypothetical protein
MRHGWDTERGALVTVTTVAPLREISEDAWAALPPGQCATTTRSFLAERISKCAARGERDPGRLHSGALAGIAA